jgi:hypothetical protein
MKKWKVDKEYYKNTSSEKCDIFMDASQWIEWTKVWTREEALEILEYRGYDL